MRKPALTLFGLVGLTMLCVACFPGGVVDRGGFSDGVVIIPSATLTRGAAYQIVCWDNVEAERRRKLAEENPADDEDEVPAKGAKSPDTKDATGGKEPAADAAAKPGSKAEAKSEPAAGSGSDSKKASGQVLGPPIRLVDPADYTGGCEQEGEHSVFFLLNLFPVTPPLNPEYAISTAVQRLEGDTMIGIQGWHEVHYYSLLGRVSVFKVRGHVIRFNVTVAPDAKGDKPGGPGGGRR